MKNSEFNSTQTMPRLHERKDPDPAVGGTPLSAPETCAPNPFDPASLRIDPAQNIELGVRKALVHVAVRKPTKQEFFRVCADPNCRITMAILELKEERETYAVTPAIANALPGEVRLVDLRLCVSRSGTIFLWPVPLPTPDGRENAWHQSARAAAELAETQWVRIVANMSAGCYDVYQAQPGIPDPIWSGETLGELLNVAFGNGHLIDSIDHPVIQRLQGK